MISRVSSFMYMPNLLGVSRIERTTLGRCLYAEFALESPLATSDSRHLSEPVRVFKAESYIDPLVGADLDTLVQSSFITCIDDRSDHSELLCRVRKRACRSNAWIKPSLLYALSFALPAIALFVAVRIGLLHIR